MDEEYDAIQPTNLEFTEEEPDNDSHIWDFLANHNDDIKPATSSFDDDIFDFSDESSEEESDDIEDSTDKVRCICRMKNIEHSINFGTKHEHENSLYSNEYYDLFPGVFSILNYDALLIILEHLELYDLRFLAMISQSFYRNFYNPLGDIFKLMVRKWRDYCPSFVQKLEKMENYDKRNFLLCHQKGIQDFDLYQPKEIWERCIGGYVTLTMRGTKKYGFISCYIKDLCTFRNIVAISQPHDFIVKSNHDVDSSSVRFKTIRHWLAHCLNCEIHQLDMKDLSREVLVIIKKGNLNATYQLSQFFSYKLNKTPLFVKIHGQKSVIFLKNCLMLINNSALMKDDTS